MKNKAILAAIAVLIIVVGGYGTYRVIKHFRRLATTPSPAVTQNQNPAAKTLKDLLTLGTAQKCTFDQGTVYIAGGKVRGDFESTVDNKTTKSHMIVDGNTSYIWTEDSPAGYKASFNPNASPQAVGTPAPGSFDANKPVNYQCGAWVTDESYFVLPKNITFTDMSALLAPSASPAAGSNSQQCSVCNSLSGDAKTQCLTALKCQ